MTLASLEPSRVWFYFSGLNAIPRASKKELAAAAWVENFGKEQGLIVLRDQIGNVVIKKNGQGKGVRSAPLILQAHLDMVHQKNAGTQFDFDTQGIDMWIDEDWVKARGTTLGADNGIGVAYMMALLENKEIDHPPLEALFTLDEEAGMGGARGLGPGLLEGKRMLNLDTEDEREITIGCAGGVDTNVELDLKMEKVPADFKALKIEVKGLKGGHSGMDIHLGRGNANKILFRLLSLGQNQGLRISAVDGGGLRNAIPREAHALVALPEKKMAAFLEAAEHLAVEIKAELSTADPGLQIIISEQNSVPTLLHEEQQRQIISAVLGVANGVYRMSSDIEGLVETSSNLARVLIKDYKFVSQSLQRSSVESAKKDIALSVRSVFELIGARVDNASDYPGWKPNPASPLLDKAVELHREFFGSEPQVNACHAGLECGIINGRYPGLDMVSIGPDIRNAHSPDEMVRISSVQKFWDYLLKLLASLD